MKEYNNIECYFKNPETGEMGWTIHFVSIPATSKKEAAEAMKKLPHFDCFIDFRFDEYND